MIFPENVKASSVYNNSLFGVGHRDPKNSDGDRVPAPIGTPQAASGGSRLAKETHFGLVTIR